MIFINRDVSEGSLISFPPNLEVVDLNTIDSSVLSNSTFKHIRSIIELSKSKAGRVVSSKEICESLNLKAATVRRVIKELVDGSLLVKTNQTHPKHKAIRLYKFCDTSDYSSPKAISKQLEVLNPPKVEPNLTTISTRYQGSYKLAMGYSPNIVPQEERFLSVPDSTLLQAIFSNFVDTSQLDFMNNLTFADILPHKQQLVAIEGQSKYNFPVPTNFDSNVEIQLSSTAGNLPTVDYIQLVYTIINLTIRFNLDKVRHDLVEPKSNFYLTPIRTIDVLKFLNLDITAQSNKQMVSHKIRVLASTGFTLSGLTDFNVMSKIGKPLFTIVGSSCNHYKGKESETPFLHLIEWDKEVLKAILRAKHFFLLPSEVVSGDNRLFLLYLYVRKQFSYKREIDIEVSNLRRILGIPQTMQPHIFARSMVRLFERYYKRQNDGKVYKNANPSMTEITINVASVHFTLVIDKNLPSVSGWHTLYIQAKFDQFEVLMASQPKYIQNKFKPFSQLPVPEQIDKLKLILRNHSSSTTPIIHNSQTGFKSIVSMIERQEIIEEAEFKAEFFGSNNKTTDDYVIEGNAETDSTLDLVALAQHYDERSIIDAAFIHPELMGDTEVLEAIVASEPYPEMSRSKNSGSAAFLKRKHSIDIRVTTYGIEGKADDSSNTFRFKVSKYHDIDSIVKISEDICKLTNGSADFYKRKIIEKVDTLDFIEICGLLITPDIFNSILKTTANNPEVNEVVDEIFILDKMVGFMSRQFKNLTTIDEDLIVETIIASTN